MRIAPLALVLALSTAPAFAQSYGHEHVRGGWDKQQNAHAERHNARDAAEAANRNAWHAQRDAAVGDYHGAEHAQRRAQAAAEDAWRHREAARHGQGGYGYGRGGTHDDRR